MAILNGLEQGYSRAVLERRDSRPGKRPALRWIDRTLEQLENSRARIAQNALQYFPRNSWAVTLSSSTEVLEVLVRAKRSGRLAGVFVSESRPGTESRKTVSQLRRARVRVVSIPDAALGTAIRSAHVAIVGADAVGTEGSVVSKLGSYLLALACRDSGKPFLVTANRLKFRRPDGSSIGPSDPRDVRSPLAPPATEGRARFGQSLFEVTPPELISHYITDRGILSARAFERK